MKLWAGRFQKETDTLVNDFNASINFDARLYRQDITGSIAHATMLGEQGIIPQMCIRDRDSTTITGQIQERNAEQSPYDFKNHTDFFLYFQLF